MKPLKFTLDQWRPLHRKILTELGPKGIIAWVLQRELGFTVRRHVENQWNDDAFDYVFREVICLDFYDESMRTFFILKYLGEQYNEG
jgi:hypothetical protein